MFTKKFFAAIGVYVLSLFYVYKTTSRILRADHEIEIKRATDQSWTLGHKSGWRYAERHYTRYYDDDTYQFVYGTPREK